MIFTIRLLAVSLILTGLVPAQSATRYVEKWGNDSNAPECVKSAPCLTIQAAIDGSSPNDKIVVGPGRYIQSITVLPALRGLKLVSTAGRHATIVQTEFANTHTMEMYAPNTQIGKKGKGFTFTGASSTSRAGLLVAGGSPMSRVKIEGNRFGVPKKSNESGDYANFYGVLVLHSGSGYKIQIRHNIFVNNNVYGLACTYCERALIQNNLFIQNGNFAAYLPNGSYSATISKNIFSANLSAGLFVPSNTTRSNVKDNVVEFSGSSWGLIVDNADGARVENNIVAFNDGNGVLIDVDDFNAPPRAMKNLIVGNQGDGAYFRAFESGKLEGNIAVDNASEGMTFVNTDTVGSVKNNAAIGSGQCGIHSTGFGETVDNYKFFGINNASGDACGDFNATGPTATKPPVLGVNVAAKLVGG